MKVMLTGAHFTPAVATIEELKKYPSVEVVYVGRKTTQEGDSTASWESSQLPKLRIKFIPIITGRLQREFTIYTIPSLLKIPIGLLQSFYIILKEKPDVIVSFGGYVAVPVVVVGWLFSIPIIVHEQTLVSGLANKICALFADKVAISFKQHQLNGRAILTGNPIRRQILAIKKNNHTKKPLVLISGGNQGSHIINLAVEEILDKLTKIADVIHVTGDSKFHDFERLQKRQNDHYLVKKWAGKQWSEYLSKADLVICRAGINTLTELAYLMVPALVIPIPYLYQDEQNINAKFFAKAGLVQILPQSKLSANTLFKSVGTMLKDLNHLKDKAREAKKVVNADAAKRLALEILIYAYQNSNH